MSNLFAIVLDELEDESSVSQRQKAVRKEREARIQTFYHLIVLESRKRKRQLSLECLQGTEFVTFRVKNSNRI